MKKEGYTLSDKGRTVLATGIDEDGTPLTPSSMLLLEIMSRTPNIGKDNALDIHRDAITVFGSPEEAVQAIRSGALEIVHEGSIH